MIARAAAEVADECRRDLGEYAAARRLYEGLLARYPESTQAMRAQRGIVNIDIKTGNYEAAEAGVKTLLAKYPNHDGLPQAFCWLGNDYLDVRQDDKAGQCYQYVIDNSPDSNAAMSSWSGIARVHIRRGDDQAVQPVIDKLIADFNDNPGLPAAVFQIGEEYWNEGFRCENAGLNEEGKDCFGKALGVWERVIAELPESPSTTQAYYLSARCYEKAGDYSKAIAFSRTVVEKWPEHQFAWNAQFCIASCYQELVWSGQIPMEEGAAKVRQACEELLAKYPQSMAAPAAREILKRWQPRLPQ